MVVLEEEEWLFDLLDERELNIVIMRIPRNPSLKIFWPQSDR
jgi:hypothetical protein